MTHPHYTPFALALDFEEGNESLTTRLLERVRSCSVCRAALEELSRWLKALDHSDPLVGPEFVTRHDLFKRLLADSPGHVERLEAVDANDLFHQWGLCRLLLEESKSCREVNPLLSAELAELSLAVADHLDPDYYQREHVADAQAQAAANYGDALRLLDDARAAQEHFEAARGRLEAGTGRTRVSSEVARLEARLLMHLGRHDEAHALLESVLDSHEARDDRSRSLLHFMLDASGTRDEG